MDYYPKRRKRRREVVWKPNYFSLKLTQGNGEPRADLVDEAVVAAVTPTGAEDDELFAKNFFKQKRILIISMIVLPPPKKCLSYLSMTLFLGILNNRQAKHLSNHRHFVYSLGAAAAAILGLKTSMMTSDPSYCQCDYDEASKEDVGMKYEPTITTCSHAASKMGSRQKVIAFTYFKGRKDEEISRKYEAGIFGNLEAIGQYYSKESLSSSSEASEEEASEWSMRVYHNLEDDDLDLCHLACLNRNRGGRFRGRSSIQPLPPLLLCNVNRNPLFGNASVILPTLWRFLPMLDDQVGKKRSIGMMRICRIEFIKRAMPSFFISWLARFREIWQRVILQFCTTPPMFPFPTNSSIGECFLLHFLMHYCKFEKQLLLMPFLFPNPYYAQFCLKDCRQTTRDTSKGPFRRREDVAIL